MVAKYEVENLALAAKNTKDINIKAPNNGVIISKNIRVGEMAMPGMPAIVLSDLSNLKISVEIAESNMKYIKRGKRVIVNIPSLKLKEIGKISAIIPNSNPMTHTFKLKVSFNTHNKSVYPGMYATVSIGDK